MAEFLPPVIFEIQANATKAIAQMQAVNGELDKMETKAIKAGGSIDVMTKASKYAGTALLGIAGVLGTVAGVSIKAALNVAESQAKLQTAVQDTGVSFQTFTPYMQKAQESMAKLTFGAEDTNQALATLTAATRNPQTALDSLSTVSDLAAFKQESLAEAASTVASASMGQAKGLRDLGIVVGKTIPKGADLNTILQALQDRTKGAAKAAADANPWKVLTTQFQVMTEQLGTALLPTFQKFVNWVSGPGINGLKAFGKWISDNKPLVSAFIGILAGMWTTAKIATFITAIGDVAKAFKALAVAAGIADVAEAFATGGASIVTTLAVAGGALAGIATAAGVGYLVDKALTSGGGITPGTKMPSSFAASGAGSNYKVAGLPTLGKFTPLKVDSGLKPTNYSTTKTSKTSIPKNKRGTAGAGSANITQNFYGPVSDPSQIGKEAAKAIKTGGR